MSVKVVFDVNELTNGLLSTEAKMLYNDSSTQLEKEQGKIIIELQSEFIKKHCSPKYLEQKEIENI